MRRKPKKENIFKAAFRSLKEVFTGADFKEFETETSRTVYEMLPQMDKLMSEHRPAGLTGQEVFNLIRILRESFPNELESNAVMEVSFQNVSRVEQHSRDAFYLSFEAEPWDLKLRDHTKLYRHANLTGRSRLMGNGD